MIFDVDVMSDVAFMSKKKKTCRIDPFIVSSCEETFVFFVVLSCQVSHT